MRGRETKILKGGKGKLEGCLKYGGLEPPYELCLPVQGV